MSLMRTFRCSMLSAVFLSALLVQTVAADQERGATEDESADTPPDVDARPDASAENNPAEDEFNEAMRRAVKRGFVYLRLHQNSDGSFGRGRYDRHVGITALGAMAFMADGNLPGRGKYGKEVERALEFVISYSTDTGLLAAETSHGPMYGHGFATLFLGEVYGASPDDKRVRDALVKAVDLIVGT